MSMRTRLIYMKFSHRKTSLKHYKERVSEASTNDIRLKELIVSMAKNSLKVSMAAPAFQNT